MTASCIAHQQQVKDWVLQRHSYGWQHEGRDEGFAWTDDLVATKVEVYQNFISCNLRTNGRYSSSLRLGRTGPSSSGSVDGEMKPSSKLRL